LEDVDSGGVTDQRALMECLFRIIALDGLPTSMVVFTLYSVTGRYEGMDYVASDIVLED
jgi:hypothetical protein